MAKRKPAKKRATKKKPANQRKPKSARILELRRKAKREGWLNEIRQGEGEEADERAMLAGCVFDHDRADHVVEFFERFGVLTEGPWAGQQFRLRDWQNRWLRFGFGWIKYSESWQFWIRRYRYLYLEVPKKNGKTPMVATLGNYLLFADNPYRQINLHLSATTKNQAERCLKHATRAYKFCPDLDELAIVKKTDGFESVQYNDNLWTVLAADAKSCDGINGHILADEFHRWVGWEFFRALRYALASQPEGLFIGITTAGSEQESACRSQHEKTKEVNAGRQTDEQFFGTIYAASPEDDPHDPETWLKANPSLGTDPDAPLKMESFKADYEAAKADPTEWPNWLQLRLNIWRNALDAWIPISLWDQGEAARANAKGKRRYQPRIDCFEKFNRRMAPGGARWRDLDSVMAFDGATTRDTTSAVFSFSHPKEDGVILSLPFFWLPERRAEELGDKVPYRHWADKNFIKLTPGDAVDFDVIFDDLRRLIEHFCIEEFYFDPMFQAEWLTAKLSEETGADRLEYPQTILHYSPAMKTAERMIHAKTWRHNGHPVFAWQLGNLKSKSDISGNIRPVKQKHGDYRTVDGPVAGIMTLRHWLTDDIGSYYDNHEVEMG